MTDTDNGKHELCREVGRRGAVIMQQDQIIALLRDEVKAWREGCSWRFAFPHEKGQAIKDAMAATDASGALEDK